MAYLTLIVGGVRSGKSRFAEQLASGATEVVYLATSQPGDEEMARRIAAHRERRPAGWRTVEEPWHVREAVNALMVAPATSEGSPPCVLLECLTLWLTNLTLGIPGHAGLEDASILQEIEKLEDVILLGEGRLVVVSHEVGCGITPANALARRFADLLGDANQRLARAAAEVFGCTAGIPLRLK